MIDMTNKLLEEFTGNMFPRGMGFPYRSNAFREYWTPNSIEEIEELIKQNKETDCYITVYPFTEYNQENRNKYSAIINCIPFDFDDEENPENALMDLKKLLAWAKRHNIQPRVQYSSFKGVHAFIDLEPIELRFPQETLRRFGLEISKAAGFNTLDHSVIGDLDRIIRIPNTINSKSGRYCIPINPSLIPFLTIKDMERMSTKKSDFVPIRVPVAGDIHTLLHEYDDMVEVELEEMKERIQREKILEQNSIFPGLSAGIPCPAFRKYIEEGASQGERDTITVAIIHKLRSDGFTKDKIFRELLEFGRKCDPPLHESYIRTKLNAHFVKNYSLCTFFSKVAIECSVCYNRRF